METINDLVPVEEVCAITPMLTELGRHLLHDPRNADGFDMTAIARICRERGIKLHGKTPTAEELEAVLKQIFDKNPEICSDGLSITGWSRRIGWENVFILRFYPDVHSHQIRMATTVLEEDDACDVNPSNQVQESNSIPTPHQNHEAI